MMKFNEFWPLAEEAMLDASRAKTDEEKRALMDLARMWTQAAFQREGLYSRSGESPRPHAALS